MSFVEALDVIEDDEPRSAAMQMAVDEALLRSATVPTLRFYRWRSPAVSFGYFSRFDDVRGLSADRELVRRWTGGGIVMHGEDLTYSFVVPPAHQLYEKSPPETYSLLHAAVTAALSSNGIQATLADTATPRLSDACFANAVRADVLLDGRKIAGAAQRRSRSGLLQQGSIQLRSLPPRFPREFCSAICATPHYVALTANCLSSAAELTEHKYGTAEWLTRR